MSQIVLKEDTSLIFRSLSVVKASFKMSLFVFTLMSYFLMSSIILLLGFVSPILSKKLLLKMMGAYAKFCLWFMDIEVNAEGIDMLPHGLIVCNHMSYLDVLILASLKPSCFVTSVEIKQTPVLGQICLLAGCLFVERRSRDNLTAEVAQVSEALKKEIPVLIFPEGTSTNGEEVIRFRRPLFQAAVDSQLPVIALTLNYPQIDGECLSKDNRDLICWYGEMSFLPHLWRFFQSQKLKAQVQISEILFEGNLEELQMKSFKAVSKNFRPLL